MGFFIQNRYKVGVAFTGLRISHIPTGRRKYMGFFIQNRYKVGVALERFDSSKLKGEHFMIVENKPVYGDILPIDDLSATVIKKQS